jgi:hypothetical protein
MFAGGKQLSCRGEFREPDPSAAKKRSRTRRQRAFRRALLFRLLVAPLVMKQRQEDDDGQWHTQHPKKNASSHS